MSKKMEFPVPKEGETIAVWFSCGAASAVAAKKTVEKYHNLCKIRILNTPIAEEDEDNRRFLNDVAAWIGIEIEEVYNIDYPDSSAVSVWEKRKAMAFPHGAPCTFHLKKESRADWETMNHADWYVFGFTTKEEHRHLRRLKAGEKVLPVLIQGRLSKADCFQIIQAAGLKLPRVYTEFSRFGEGYPNANCIGCVKATSPTYWNHVRETRPEIFRERSEQSRRLNVRLVEYKGKRIFLDELPPDARGRSMKTMKTECGILCEVPK